MAQQKMKEKGEEKIPLKQATAMLRNYILQIRGLTKRRFFRGLAKGYNTLVDAIKSGKEEKIYKKVQSIITYCTNYIEGSRYDPEKIPIGWRMRRSFPDFLYRSNLAAAPIQILSSVKGLEAKASTASAA